MLYKKPTATVQKYHQERETEIPLLSAAQPRENFFAIFSVVAPTNRAAVCSAADNYTQLRCQFWTRQHRTV